MPPISPTVSIFKKSHSIGKEKAIPWFLTKESEI